ncbi:uncharacterized protein [Physcomitrium patens]|uniref:Uncharacterized protein n=1 Tax=Physcomitrium patens TaxID=3218 RepID=A0A2K1KX85_PHYPA|nr:hypothetical protein PHYPA_005351 [Physcomitrium patens]
MKMATQSKTMAILLIAAVLCCEMVAPTEGRALLNIDKLVDHLKAHCPPPSEDPVRYTAPVLPPNPTEYEPSPEYKSPPYAASPSPKYPSPSPVYSSSDPSRGY